jgi:epoxyqueuosine reductase
MSESHTLSAAVRTEALSYNFADIGFSAATEAESIATYRHWLKNGYAADMDYLHRHADLKQHPANVAPGVKTIIAVAARYPTNQTPGTGFSTYARGLDYHDVIRTKQRQLAKFINEREPLTVHRICVDSAPLLEREWAQRAGLGWIGKQGQLVSKKAGCCLLLGFLLVDIELPESTPIENACGNCRLCLESCPTGALLGNHLLDARRCISYLTIEPKAEIPRKLEQKISGSLFGCDCCTAVCPWNKNATAPIMPELQQTEPLPEPQELLEWSENKFSDRFKNTAVYRTGLAQLQRNARL